VKAIRGVGGSQSCGRDYDASLREYEVARTPRDANNVPRTVVECQRTCLALPPKVKAMGCVDGMVKKNVLDASRQIPQRKVKAFDCVGKFERMLWIKVVEYFSKN
jgi:hypothetical protein